MLLLAIKTSSFKAPVCTSPTRTHGAYSIWKKQANRCRRILIGARVERVASWGNFSASNWSASEQQKSSLPLDGECTYLGIRVVHAPDLHDVCLECASCAAHYLVACEIPSADFTSLDLFLWARSLSLWRQKWRLGVQCVRASANRRPNLLALFASQERKRKYLPWAFITTCAKTFFYLGTQPVCWSCAPPHWRLAPGRKTFDQ